MLEYESIVQQKFAIKLGEDASFLIGPFGSSFTVENYTDDSSYRYIRGKDVKPLTLMDNDNVYMPAADYERLKRYALREDDILVSVVGTLGNSAIVSKDVLPATFSCKSTVIRPKSLNPKYLTVYLNCKYGSRLLARKERGVIQTGLNLDDLKDLPVFLPSAEFQACIAAVFDESLNLVEFGKAKIAEAETTLLAALGLAGWLPPEPLSYTARAADALTAARLDAQYFRPKYNEAVALLHAKGNAAPLASLVKLNSRGRQPIYADAGLPVINSKHVRTNQVNLGDDNRFGEVGKSPIVIQNNDVLLNGTGVGTIGRAAPYLFEHHALPDNHVTVIRPDGIDPIYLSVFLNSTLGQLQIEQLIKGSSGQIELYPDDIAKIIVWDAPTAVQTAVRTSLLAAKALEARSRALLSAAKRAVEIAIEDSEAAALAFLAGAA